MCFVFVVFLCVVADRCYCNYIFLLQFQSDAFKQVNSSQVMCFHSCSQSAWQFEHSILWASWSCPHVKIGLCTKRFELAPKFNYQSYEGLHKAKANFANHFEVHQRSFYTIQGGAPTSKTFSRLKSFKEGFLIPITCA